MSTDKKKRFRAANFTAEEVNILIRLALKEKHILENKQTDSEVWKLKSQTWERIAANFNASSGQTFRSVETLRLKYVGLKKDLKKKVNKNKAETLKTGGGNPDYIPITGPEKELLEVLSLSVHGLTSNCDSDSVLPPTTITGEIKTKLDIREEQELQELMPTITEEEIASYDLPVFQVIAVNELKSPVDHAQASCSEPEVHPASESVVENIENINPQKNATAAWKNWSPRTLKSKKHPLLTPKRKKGEERNKKIDDLLRLREELVRQQIHHTQQEERRAQEKHEREMKLLNLQIIIKEKNV